VTRVWLPFDDWAEHLTVPEGVEIDVWHSGLPLPASHADVQLYVPEYMGPPAALEVLASLPSLEVVQTLTAGVDDVLPHLPHGVTLCNARGVHDASTAELVVGLIIASLRGLPDFVRAQPQGQWVHDRYRSLADRTVLLVGYGSVGKAVARRLEGFEIELVPVASTARPGVAGVDELPGLLLAADVVILTVPLTDRTRRMVDARFLARMPDGALLVNAARGPVVDTEALVAEVSSGRLLAALDVTDPEPLPPDHPLWTAPGVLISPHVGGHTSAYLPRARALVGAQLQRFARGAALENVVVAGRKGVR
jgi:phosphoglycerate dehydrogenase-like enzyme